MNFIMEMAYELEAQGVYGAEDNILSAEDIVSVLEALQMREISFQGFWDFQTDQEISPVSEQL